MRHLNQDADVSTWPSRPDLISLMKTSGTPDTRRAARGRFPGLDPELRNSSQVFGAKKTFSSDSSPVFFDASINGGDWIRSLPTTTTITTTTTPSKVLFYNLHKWYLIKWNKAQKSRRDVWPNDVFVRRSDDSTKANPLNAFSLWHQLSIGVLGTYIKSTKHRIQLWWMCSQHTVPNTNIENLMSNKLGRFLKGRDLNYAILT